MRFLLAIFVLWCSSVQSQNHGSFNRRLEKEYIVNIGAQFAIAPIFVNRTFIHLDTLYLNLGSTIREEGGVNLNILMLDLLSGKSRVENYAIVDSLRADKRSFPGSIKVTSARIYVQEGSRVLIFERENKALWKFIPIEKGFNLSFVKNDETLVLYDCYFDTYERPLKVQLVEIESGLKQSIAFNLAYQELSFMGFPRLLAADSNKFYVSDLGQPKLIVLDSSLAELGTYSVPTKFWFDDKEILEQDKKLKKIKDKDPMEYGRILASEHVSRISNIVLLNDERLLVAIVHPNETFENVCVSTKDFSCLFSDTISVRELKERISTIGIEDYRPWDTFAYGYVDSNYLISIGPSNGKYKFDNRTDNEITDSDDDYFLSFKIFD